MIELLTAFKIDSIYNGLLIITGKKLKSQHNTNVAYNRMIANKLTPIFSVFLAQRICD